MTKIKVTIKAGRVQQTIEVESELKYLSDKIRMLESILQGLSKVENREPVHTHTHSLFDQNRRSR